MRISKESSGGRGEYEWLDLRVHDPSPGQLRGRRIFLQLPGGVAADTGCVFALAQGKQRVRLASDMAGRKELHPPWHVAALLMLPRPSRDESSWQGGQPVMRDEEYGIVHLHIGGIDISSPGRAVIEVLRVEVQNQSGSEEISFRDRLELVRSVWAESGRLENAIRGLLEEHRQLVTSGGGVAPHGLRIVRDLQRRVSAAAADYLVIPNTPNTDVLPALVSITQPVPAEPSLNPQEVPQEDIVLKRRTIAQQRQRLAAARDAAAVRFRRKVQRAYGYACIVCGLKLPPVGSGGSPGVDAAHILPYSEYDLDDVRNGLCLCKQHHWAFDEGLIHIRWNGRRYEALVPDTARQRITDSGAEIDVAYLDSCAGPIPRSRLPNREEEWPSRTVLEALESLLFS